MQSYFPRKDHKKPKSFTKQKLLSLRHQTKGLKRCFSFKEKKQKTKWHPEDKWAEQTPDGMQFITKLQTHCLSKTVTAVIVLIHLNYHISHCCGDYSTSINHKSFIFLAGLLVRELRQDIMPCTVIFHCGSHYVLMTLLLVVTPTGDMMELTCKWQLCSSKEDVVVKPRSQWGFVLDAPKLTWCRAKAWLSHRNWEALGSVNWDSSPIWALGWSWQASITC